ncbi:MAG: rhodanese-like domain-containing protein [Gemmatimonadota bacterium]|nr:rhodanese-like domain-containing protein [Gemmatimonadota bacterium]
MTGYDQEKAKGFFAEKVAFTTGTHEVLGMIQRGDDNVIVDVRLPSDYRTAHVPGAVNLPNGRWHTAAGLSRDKLNVLYCYSQTCHLAAQAAAELASRGYPVMEMEGGFATWEVSGYAVESSGAESKSVAAAR